MNLHYVVPLAKLRGQAVHLVPQHVVVRSLEIQLDGTARRRHAAHGAARFHTDGTVLDLPGLLHPLIDHLIRGQRPVIL